MSNNRIPKFRDVALRGKSQGKVPQRHVLVYSFGDEMYCKVRTTALMPLNKERLRKPYGSDEIIFVWHRDPIKMLSLLLAVTWGFVNWRNLRLGGGIEYLKNKIINNKNEKNKHFS